MTHTLMALLLAAVTNPVSIPANAEAQNVSCPIGATTTITWERSARDIDPPSPREQKALGWRIVQVDPTTVITITPTAGVTTVVKLGSPDGKAVTVELSCTAAAIAAPPSAPTKDVASTSPKTSKSGKGAAELKGVTADVLKGAISLANASDTTLKNLRLTVDASDGSHRCAVSGEVPAKERRTIGPEQCEPALAPNAIPKAIRFTADGGVVGTAEILTDLQ